MTLVASFQRIEYLRLACPWFIRSEVPHPVPERRTYKGRFDLWGCDGSSEGFVALLAEHELQYREMTVQGEYWLQDTVWGRCLVKCADRLEQLNIFWSATDGANIFR